MTFVVAALACVAAPVSAEVIDRIVAVVGGQIITKSDVDSAAVFGLAPNLQALIDRTLMLSELRRVSPPDPAPAAVDGQVAQIRAKFPAAADFARALESGGLDEAAVRSFAADEVRLSAYLNERFSAAAQPSEDEVRQAGESSREKLFAERRQTLVNAWIAELRRRTEISVLQ
jgi:parvulin-like peptidyl-prolyl isomerase